MDKVGYGEFNHIYFRKTYASPSSGQYTSWETRYIKMDKGNWSEKSPRFIFGFEKFRSDYEEKFWKKFWRGGKLSL